VTADLKIGGTPRQLGTGLVRPTRARDHPWSWPLAVPQRRSLAPLALPPGAIVCPPTGCTLARSTKWRPRSPPQEGGRDVVCLGVHLLPKEHYRPTQGGTHAAPRLRSRRHRPAPSSVPPSLAPSSRWQVDETSCLPSAWPCAHSPTECFWTVRFRSPILICGRPRTRPLTPVGRHVAGTWPGGLKWGECGERSLDHPGPTRWNSSDGRRRHLDGQLHRCLWGCRPGHASRCGWRPRPAEGDADIATVGVELDRKIAGLLDHLGVDVPEPLRSSWRHGLRRSTPRCARWPQAGPSFPA